MVRNAPSTTSDFGPLGYLETFDWMSSITSGAVPWTQLDMSPRTSQIDNTPPSTFDNLDISVLSNTSQIYSRFETPRLPSAEFVWPSVPSESGLVTVDVPSTFGSREANLSSTLTFRPPDTPNVHPLAMNEVSSLQRLFAQRPPLAQTANNAPSLNMFHSTPPLDSPNTNISIDRTLQTPTTPNVPLQPCRCYSSPHMYDQSLQNSMWSTTPTITPQRSLLPRADRLLQQQMHGSGFGPSSLSPSIIAQAEVDVERQRQRQQHQIRAQYRMQQPRITPDQRQYAEQNSQQAILQRPHGQSMMQPPVNFQQRQQFLNVAAAQPHAQTQAYSPVHEPALFGPKFPQNNKRAASFLDERPSKQVRIVDPRDLEIKKDLRSQSGQQDVLTLLGGSGLPPVQQADFLGRQHPLRQITPGPAKFITSAAQQRELYAEKPQNVNDMSRKRQDSGLVDPQPPQKRSKLPPGQHEAHPALEDDVQHIMAATQAQTPIRNQPQLRLKSISPTYPLHRKTLAHQTPATAQLKSWKSQHINLEHPPDDVFASVLQSTIDNAKCANTGLMNQENPTLHASQHEVLLTGPLTKEQNSQALVEAVKEDMKRRGPVVGTNPDLDTPAKPPFILDQRRKWTEVAMRELGYSTRDGVYVLANKVMESAVGYNPYR